MKKVLIAGLGNIGGEYTGTRHNIGFDVLDHLVDKHDVSWEKGRHAHFTKIRLKGFTIHLIKPTTYMNRSGSAVRYWLEHLKIDEERLLIVTDDLNLPFGTLRLRKKGSSGGHNGLEDINQSLGHTKYARLRFGIGSDFAKGRQVDFVLGQWTDEQMEELSINLVPKATEMCLGFVLEGADRTMSKFNN